MGKMVKGQSGNPSGRPKGAVGKQTKQVKESLQWVMEKLESTLVQDIQAVSPQRRLQLYTDLMNYVKPKLSANKDEININQESNIEVRINYLNPIISIDNINKESDNDSN
jgi:hypothetical protein